MARDQQRGVRKVREGVVVSDAMDKTRVVRVERHYRHPLYGKVIKQSKKFYAHDEKNESHVGDRVRIMEVRPLSHLKRWRLLEIVSKSSMGSL